MSDDELTPEQNKDRLSLIAALEDFRDADDEDSDAAETAMLQLARSIEARLAAASRTATGEDAGDE